jgi:EAL domain-containing protein (putative c-di-GMP-specific phosphodiesterase class I)
MRTLGTRLAIDDFGTGFSSLARLRDLRVDVLKIDQTFVRDATRVPADAAIIESVLSLGHRLGMEVVAEGCEDQQTLTYLRSCQIDYVQGFFVGRPMNADPSRLVAEQAPAQLRPSVPALKRRARRPALP